MLVGAAVWLGGDASAGDKRDWQAVELTGRVTEFWQTRNWADYYWREDFTFILTEDGTKRPWRIISREPTPAYEWRMGTTFTGLKVDWPSGPRVKVVGIKAVDRIPASFYDFKLKEPNLATALIVFVETRAKETAATQAGRWQEYYVNNWFHPWGKKADKVIHGHFAGKSAPYDIYGFARGTSAPFDKKSRAVIERHKENPSLMFHGKVKTAEDNTFGYEIELIDLIGRDVKTGGAKLLFGDARTIPRLDSRKAGK